MSMLTPEPPCKYGFPRDAIEQILAEDVDNFDQWMRGQTIAICDGREFDHDLREYHETGCGPHGPVVYAWDLERYLRRPR